MKEPQTPFNEEERMELIRQLDILDTDAEEIYDGITYLASMACNKPVSTITIIDRHRQWFKSIVGANEKENPRIYSFCAHAILGNEILEVKDSQLDERFKDNPLVTGDPHVRYYAGAPIELKDGLRVGTLCVIDHKPNKLSDEQLKILRFLSLQVTKLLELRLKVKEVEILRENDRNLVSMLTHELRNPLTSVSGYLSMINQIKKISR
ncbi:MAG: GAF domain-containing protein [Parachlamydiaceae bacterium]|nr:MAG: GAF domain-containing protein [Parachlamydiaceae bacterium]